MEKWIVHAFASTAALIDKGSVVAALPPAWAIRGAGLLVVARG